MKNRYLWLLLFAINFQALSQTLHYQYSEIPLGQITPTNWLKQQSDILKNGSTGHLDEFHKKIQVDNGWLGGKGDDWEETPYWLDGALPLAYITKDPTLIQKVNN